MDEADAIDEYWPNGEDADPAVPAKSYTARVEAVWIWRDRWGVTSLDAVRRLGGDDAEVDDLFTVER